MSARWWSTEMFHLQSGPPENSRASSCDSRAIRPCSRFLTLYSSRIVLLIWFSTPVPLGSPPIPTMNPFTLGRHTNRGFVSVSRALRWRMSRAISIGRVGMTGVIPATRGESVFSPQKTLPLPHHSHLSYLSLSLLIPCYHGRDIPYHWV